MKMRLTMVVAGILLAGSAQAGEACLYGKAQWQDGSKIDGSSHISTSWNSKQAYPKNGEYRLCLDGVSGQRITVYLNGNDPVEVVMNGDTRLDIVGR